MGKIKIIAFLIWIVLLVGATWAGLVSRKSAQAGAPPAVRTEQLQREMDETGRIVNGRPR